jgi:hypothetical protein
VGESKRQREKERGRGSARAEENNKKHLAPKTYMSLLHIKCNPEARVQSSN